MKLHLKHIAFIWLLAISQFAIGATVDFYGHEIDFSINTLRVIKSPTTITKQSIHQASVTAKKVDIATLINQINQVKNELELDGLGTVLLAKKISSSVSPFTNTQNIVLYRILNQLEFDVQLTYTRKSITCFGYLDEKPAASVYIVYKGKRYTNLTFNDFKTEGTRFVYTNNSTIGNSINKPIHFTGNAPAINAKQATKYLSWEFQGKFYHLKAIENISFNEYLKDLPQFKLGGEYVKMNHSKEFKKSVIDPLKTYLDGMSSNSQKSNFLLKFVQTAFHYKTDGEQYGFEKYNFPEETVSSSYSDCEDRTLLLAFLYKNLLGFNSVILHFEKEKHVCLGVEIPNREITYSFKYGQKLYMVCEPTGIGYNVGDPGIALKNITEVIELY